ncbi:protein of unknown function [Afipia carboxidovorans OM5]|uniref:Transmembrane protein n=1 Tax=Afipia carboxidovorans (strain ATCC 49405 / DSM 1227 / KCTC 32145 / OM5) TaxID=504832 RepID=B6JHM6_AFIC5|nr:hypothetical protein [Afipia carboxidovorans]ACI93582.1 protein of unknown function [Afipia carboxidovorans OM5]AEI02721.1 hypothetical protein OCA4_c15830 [Afipia carboxidovorans OM4]AEI06297.1 hypothetical protein OCA5_c15830 [Afipia carboxidovorans OM5]BEV47092.1 hypothetical protein CRBSH125_32750 [Afipia carboxidovorans]
MMYQGILLPVFVLVALTFVVLLRRGRPGPIAEGAFSFPLHILFYVLVAYAITLRQADLVMVLLAWVFLAIEALQAGILLRSSREKAHGSFFTAGTLVLLAMWVYFALRILFPQL